jgi:hypothetical protein
LIPLNASIGDPMGEVIQFVPKRDREREALIREARAIYESIFPGARERAARPQGLIAPARRRGCQRRAACHRNPNWDTSSNWEKGVLPTQLKLHDFFPPPGDERWFRLRGAGRWRSRFDAAARQSPTTLRSPIASPRACTALPAPGRVAQIASGRLSRRGVPLANQTSAVRRKQPGFEPSGGRQDIHLRSPTSAHLLEGLAQPPGEAFRLPYEKPAGGLHSVRLGFARGIVSRERHRKNHRKCELVHRRPELAVLTCSHSLHPVIH